VEGEKGRWKPGACRGGMKVVWGVGSTIKKKKNIHPAKLIRPGDHQPHRRGGGATAHSESREFLRGWWERFYTFRSKVDAALQENTNASAKTARKWRGGKVSKRETGVR